MSQYQSELLRLLDERGYIQDITDGMGLDALAQQQVVPGYIGFDATAPSLHVGSLVQIMMLRRLQQAGHKPIVVMGGGTSKVGDPSFKDEARVLLDTKTIKRNIESIQGVFAQFLQFGDGPTDAVMIDNGTWLDRRWYMKFLRDYGAHFSINRMLEMDSVRLRLDREQSLSFLEFNYMILQAFDFLELSRRLDCRLQMGGSDQWGNICNGIDLARRVDGTRLYGLTTPLITTADGGKMGKTASGAIWLNAEQLSPYDYWQYWRNTHDADVGRFLKMFTDLSLSEIEGIMAGHINSAKARLATEATAMLHSRVAAERAAETARLTFEEGSIGDALPSLDVEGEIDPIEALVGLKLASSKNEARRHLSSGAVRADGYKINAETGNLRVTGYPVRISVGRKKHGVLKPK